MGSDTIFNIIKILIGGVEVATANEDNEMVKEGLDLAKTVVGTAEVAIELDSEIGERIRAFADEIETKREAGGQATRGEFEEVAADVRAATDRWNAAG